MFYISLSRTMLKIVGLTAGGVHDIVLLVARTLQVNNPQQASPMPQVFLYNPSLHPILFKMSSQVEEIQNCAKVLRPHCGSPWSPCSAMAGRLAGLWESSE